MATIINKKYNGTRKQSVTSYGMPESLAIQIIEQDKRDYSVCGDCNNYNAGACGFRLNSPDYMDYKVQRDDVACDAFNAPVSYKPDMPAFDSMRAGENIPEEDLGKSTDFRKILESSLESDGKERKWLQMQVISVSDLYKLGHKDQQYPVIAVTVRHKGEMAVFFLPNTKEVKVDSISVAGNRYDVINMFRRIKEKKAVKLSHWTRLKIID